MTDITSCQHVRCSLGVYVLGAIDPAERADVDAHLATCADCRDELAGLAGLPALLGRVPAAEAARIAGLGLDNERLTLIGREGGEPDAAGDTVTPLLRTMAHRRRVNRWRALAAAAAVLIIGAGSAIGAIRLSGTTARPAAGPHWEHAAAANATTHAGADIKYLGMSSGTEVDVRVWGIRAGTTCQFWVLGVNGKRWVAGSWTVPEGWHSPWYQAISAAPVGAVRGFQITSGHTALVSIQA